MKYVAILFLLVHIGNSLFAQDFQVPRNYKFEKAEDYAPYESVVIQCTDWLISTPANQQPELRKEVNQFLLKWLSGSPTVHIAIHQPIVPFMETNPDLLFLFMGAWAKYSLETKEFDDAVAGSLAGLEAVIAFYQKNKEVMPKDKHVEKFIKMKDKGTLSGFVADTIGGK